MTFFYLFGLLVSGMGYGKAQAYRHKGLLTFAVIATLAAIITLIAFKINPVYILDVNTKKLGLDK